MQEKRLDSFFIFVFVLLNVLLKSLYVNSNEIAIDEPFSIMVAQMPFADIVRFLAAGNNPPLFELLLSGIVKTVGVGLPGVRLISLFASSFTVIFIYLIGTRFCSRKVGVSAALIFTFATFQIYFSHEARVYALFNLLSCASVYYFLAIQHKQRLTRNHFILLFVNTLLLYSHYFGVVLLGMELVWMAVFASKQLKSFLLFGLVFLGCMLFYIPQILALSALFTQHGTAHWLEQPSFSDLYINLMKMLNAPVTTVLCIALLLAAFVKFLLAKKTAWLNTQNGFITFWFVGGYLGMFVVSFIVPVFLERYLIFVSGGLYLLIAISINYLFGEEKSWPAHGVIALVFIFSTKLNPTNGREWAATIIDIKQSKNKNTCLVMIPSWIQQTISYHYNIEYFKDYKHTTPLMVAENCFAINNVDDLARYQIPSFKRIIFMDGGSQYTDAKQAALNTLKNEYTIIETNTQLNGLTIYYLEKNDN